MINIDFLTLKAFISENKKFLINSRLQKIQQPSRRELILHLRNLGKSQKLYINIFPQMYHVAFMSKENELKRNIKIPQNPPMFCMLLRKYIEGAKIIEAKNVDNERIIELYFETYNELSEKKVLCLSLELMGKHSNIILYEIETSIIIGCAHNVGAEKSRYRELQGGLKYIYPPPIAFELPNELKVQFNGLTQDEINKYLSCTPFTPALYGDKYTLFAELVENPHQKNSVNEMLDDYYANYQQEYNLRIEKDKLKAITNSKLSHINNAIKKISQLLSKRDKTELYKKYGELLTANLYSKKDYQKSIELVDYYTGNNIVIDLDENKTLNENAQRYYKLYVKSKTTKEKSQTQLDKLYVEKQYYEDIEYSLMLADNYENLAEISQELGIGKEEKHKEIKPIIEKVNISGFDVYIGKNNKQNDHIVSKLAKDDDYWFHTRTCSGSHVLLKVNGVEPDEKVLFECCKLARKYSSANQPSKVSVIYTKAKNLKKPPSSPLGYVTYKNEKEVLI